MPTGELPYLILPSGKIVDLVVDGKAPCLTASGSEALGQWNGAVAESAAALERWFCGMPGAVGYLNEVEEAGGPPLRSIQTRTTMDLHTHNVIGCHSYIDVSPPKRVDHTQFGSRPVDAISDFN